MRETVYHYRQVNNEAAAKIISLRRRCKIRVII